MTLDIVRGNFTNPAIRVLIESLKDQDIDGTLYIGYPVIASADDRYTIEALLVSKGSGFIAFVFPRSSLEIKEIVDEQDSVFYLLEANLKRHESLRKKRDIAVKPDIVAFFPSKGDIPPIEAESKLFACPENIDKILLKCAPIEEAYYRPLCAAIQRVTTIKPRKKRENVKRTDSKGAILKHIEKEIANLDKWQKSAAIEVPDGPQRIRGLAGSGKTIVLALKAAYLHTQYPDWNIAITFHTRSLRQQFEDLIERFTFDHISDKPDWSKIKVLNSWGSPSDPGIYSELCKELGIPPTNYAAAKEKFGMSKAFEGVCKETLSYINSNPFRTEHYDAILVDEAQDLPRYFFQLLYEIAKKPKRIVWAYDELQNLSDATMYTVAELFGLDNDGNPRVSVQNVPDHPKKDIILPTCYRNTPWALTIAHALGFGIYREEGLVQLFDELELWKDIGYYVESGQLGYGQNIVLKRREDSYPSFFEDLLTSDESTIVTESFQDSIQQYEWVSEQIKLNISDDELDPDDILVVFPDPISAQKQFKEFSYSLQRRGIETHLAGTTTSRDTFTIKNSVTSAHIYRAKGNEAPMVYILHANYCSSGYELKRLRNILFTAITRSRAWVRVCGVGANQKVLKAEVSRVINNNFKLSFRIPSESELEKIKIIHRDRTAEEIRQIKEASKTVKTLLQLIEDGVVSPEDSPELRALIQKIDRPKK